MNRPTEPAYRTRCMPPIDHRCSFIMPNAETPIAHTVCVYSRFMVNQTRLCRSTLGATKSLTPSYRFHRSNWKRGVCRSTHAVIYSRAFVSILQRSKMTSHILYRISDSMGSTTLVHIMTMTEIEGLVAGFCPRWEGQTRLLSW